MVCSFIKESFNSFEISFPLSKVCTIFLEDMVMDELVTPCNAIVSLDASLVNVGDYIELCSAYDQVS